MPEYYVKKTGEMVEATRLIGKGFIELGNCEVRVKPGDWLVTYVTEGTRIVSAEAFPLLYAK